MIVEDLTLFQKSHLTIGKDPIRIAIYRHGKRRNKIDRRLKFHFAWANGLLLPVAPSPFFLSMELCRLKAIGPFPFSSTTCRAIACMLQAIIRRAANLDHLCRLLETHRTSKVFNFIHASAAICRGGHLLRDSNSQMASLERFAEIARISRAFVPLMG